VRRSAADDPNRPESRKEVREKENVAFPGGLRNPWRACRLNPLIRSLGVRARQVIEAFIDRHGEKVLSLYERLGDKDATGTPDDLLAELRTDLAAMLAPGSAASIDLEAVADEARGLASVFRPGLMEAYSRAAGDL